MQQEPWSRAKKANDQPAFNWALDKNAAQVYLTSMLTNAGRWNFSIATRWDLSPNYVYDFLQADLYLLPQAAFPTGGLYFKNKTWVKETKGMHVIIHNNYILGFEKKIKRFHDYDLWLVDDHADESPLGRIWNWTTSWYMYICFGWISFQSSWKLRSKCLLPVCLAFLYDGNSMEGKGREGKKWVYMAIDDAVLITPCLEELLVALYHVLRVRCILLISHIFWL